MSFQLPSHDNSIRSISTSDVDELSSFQINKNRRYTQLQPGHLKGDYLEANLGNVQIFRESLNAGALIEAFPLSIFLPFGVITTNTDNFNFCGKKGEKNTLIQATGGHWDVNFKHDLSFVVAVFNREYFSRNIEVRTGEEVPNDWLMSKASLTDPYALKDYALGLNNILNIIKNKPALLTKDTAQRMMADSILNLAYNVLNKTTSITEQPVSQLNKARGVRRVIDYLHHYSAQVPTITELCKVAKLSERNLQYAFKEYLGITPIRYLRLIRLNGVRRDLLLSSSKNTRIVDVALNWGFVEMGRFSGEYRQLCQELPSTTLSNVRMFS